MVLSSNHKLFVSMRGEEREGELNSLIVPSHFDCVESLLISWDDVVSTFPFYLTIRN